MNNLNRLQNLKLRPGIAQYFLDLDLAGPTTYGLSRIVKRNLWLIACYLSFGLGVFARQIFSYNESSLGVNQAGVTPMSLLAAFAVGMAIFPFALRSIIKLVNWIFQVEPLRRRRQGFNIVHLMASYALGYFFNLIAEHIPVILSKVS